MAFATGARAGWSVRDWLRDTPPQGDRRLPPLLAAPAAALLPASVAHRTQSSARRDLPTCSRRIQKYLPSKRAPKIACPSRQKFRKILPARRPRWKDFSRSEEHTSELQS